MQITHAFDRSVAFQYGSSGSIDVYSGGLERVEAGRTTRDVSFEGEAVGIYGSILIVIGGGGSTRPRYPML
jgi:hypothetical protein